MPLDATAGRTRAGRRRRIWRKSCRCFRILLVLLSHLLVVLLPLGGGSPTVASAGVIVGVSWGVWPRSGSPRLLFRGVRNSVSQSSSSTSVVSATKDSAADTFRSRPKATADVDPNPAGEENLKAVESAVRARVPSFPTPQPSPPPRDRYGIGGREVGTSKTRRDALQLLALRPFASLPTVLLSCLAFPPIPSSFAEKFVTASDVGPSSPFGVSDDVVSSLAFERILGKGSFKTVYLVSSPLAAASPGRNPPVEWALAVERLRFKSDARDAIRGITVAQRLRGLLSDDGGQDYFERVDGWWVQSSPPPSNLDRFEPGALVFPHPEEIEGRTRKTPSRFLGSRWLIALKAVYDVDLKSFARRAPALYPIGSTGGADAAARDATDEVAVVAGVPLTEGSALRLALDMCRAGRIMHNAGIVHRDIKPKNVMLLRGRPVIIDFEFAQFVGVDQMRGDVVCVINQAKVKGDVRYVLSEDAARFRGCQRGDAYAMGKTLYETLFGPVEGVDESAREAITEEGARGRNELFRATLADEDAGGLGRFLMSGEVRDILMGVIRGMCREERSMSFAEAEEVLLAKTASLI